MNKFELFCLIYLALDAGGTVSAVRNVFEDFCSFVGDTVITVENSFHIARDYIHHINIEAVSRSFSTLEKDQWTDAVTEYLSKPHKGDSTDR